MHHPFERAERLCRDCGHWLCDQCAVTPWGPRKPALCVDCAISRSGVRSNAAQTPVRSDREIRRLERQSRDDEPPSVLGPASTAALQRATPVVAQGGDQAEPVRRSRFRRLRPST